MRRQQKIFIYLFIIFLDDDDSYKCVSCTSEYRHRRNLIAHYRRKHAGDDGSVQIRAEGLRPTSYLLQHDLIARRRHEHGDEIQVEEAKETVVTEEGALTISSETRNKCAACPATYKYKNSLTRHHRHKHGKEVRTEIAYAAKFKNAKKTIVAIRRKKKKKCPPSFLDLLSRRREHDDQIAEEGASASCNNEASKRRSVEEKERVSTTNPNYTPPSSDRLFSLDEEIFEPRSIAAACNAANYKNWGDMPIIKEN